MVMQCGSPKYVGANSVTDAQVQAIFGADSNNNKDNFTPTLSSLFINGSNESGVPAFNASTLSSFFDATSYIGAVKNSSDTWYAGWTCNSAAANFGSGSGLCTSLPTT